MLNRVRNFFDHGLDRMLHGGHLVRASHRPNKDDGSRVQFRDMMRDIGSSNAPDGLPLPPENLRMGYGNDEQYWKRATATSMALKSVLSKYGVAVEEGFRVLDWGCASGRVIRGFYELADKAEIWGSDSDANCIAWNKFSLSPPFRFVTTTCWPNLPFSDAYFDFVYGISVFTHIAELIDTWVLEMRRVLKPGGYALFTIHDESSLEYFRERNRLPFWLPAGTDLNELAKHEVVIVRGGDWSRNFTVFQSDWIKKEWGQYLEVIDIVPRFEQSQSAVILRKA